MSILFVFDPIANIFVSVFVVICTLAMLLTIEPISLIFLAVGVGVDAEAILAVLMPFTVINSSALVVVSTSTVFLAIQEFSLVLFTRGVDVVAVSSELIFLPGAHIHVFIGERVDSLAAAAILVLSDVFAAIRVSHLLILGSETACVVEKLCEELLSWGVEGMGVVVARRWVCVAGVEMKGGDLHEQIQYINSHNIIQSFECVIIYLLIL